MSFQPGSLRASHLYYFTSLTALVSMVKTKQRLYSALCSDALDFPSRYLLFFQLLRRALVGEHGGDGCEYLIVGDLLAAAQVPHCGRSRDSDQRFMENQLPIIPLSQ